MLPDILSKPLHGAEYDKFRGKLMSIPMEYDDNQPFDMDEDKDKKTAEFAIGTKPGSYLQNGQKWQKQPIYYGDWLQGCVEKQYKTNQGKNKAQQANRNKHL